MVKSVLSVYHRGLRDWVIQRVSAMLMFVYIIGFVIYLGLHPDLSFTAWHHVFSLQWVKVASILFILSILFHAWIGYWTVSTDYIKPYIIRSFLNLFVILTLLACFFWAILILWSV